MEQSKVSVENIGGAVVVTVLGERLLEDADIRTVHGSITNILERTPRARLVIDFRNIRFLSSAVLGLLIRASKRVYEKGGAMRLCGINPKVLEIFRITRLDKIFDIHPDVKDAVESLGVAG
jgi:anti-sigma B factor antagonist